MDIAEFISARLDEDEAAAKWASAGPWALRAGGYVVGGPDGRDGSPAVTVAAETQQWNGGHIARHDPARVLREVEAKRKILWAHPPRQSGRRMVCSHCHYGNVLGANWPCLTMTSMAGIWSDHPDFRQEWAP